MISLTLAEIETAVRAQRGGWQTLFRREGASWQCILFPRHRLSEQDYRILAHRLNSPELTPDDIRRNRLRGITEEADEGGRRYGR